MENQIEKRMLRSEVPIDMTLNLKELFESREIWKERLLLNEKNFNPPANYESIQKVIIDAFCIYIGP